MSLCLFLQEHGTSAVLNLRDPPVPKTHFFALLCFFSSSSSSFLPFLTPPVTPAACRYKILQMTPCMCEKLTRVQAVGCSVLWSGRSPVTAALANH